MGRELDWQNTLGSRLTGTLIPGECRLHFPNAKQVQRIRATPDPCDRTDSLTNFTRPTREFVQRLHESGMPVQLTVDGKSEVVVQAAAAYQRLVDQASRADREVTVAAIRHGLADAEAGHVKPAREALKALAEEYGITTPSK